MEKPFSIDEYYKTLVATENATLFAHNCLIKHTHPPYNMNDRPNWDEYFKDMTLIVSKRSSCDRLHVGCILVLDNRIISCGYNGFLPRHPHTSIVRDNHEQATVHAEQNAIADCAKRGISCNNSICYITHYPCLHCAKILAAAGVKEIKYIHDYNNNELVEQIVQIQITQIF